jgi:hypothetical protein
MTTKSKRAPHPKPLPRDLARLQPRTAPPPDPGFIPGGIRDRALGAVLARGPVPEGKEKTKASQDLWRAFRKARDTKGTE